MLLSVFDRITLINILPREGDFRTLKQLRQLKEDLAFTDEENAALQFQYEDGGLVRWQREADVPKDIQIGETMHEVIRDTFMRLDQQKKLREEHLELYERFVDSDIVRQAEAVARGG